MYVRRAVMEKTKLIIRVPCDLLENVKQFAAQNHTTLTELIEAYLLRIPAQHPFENAPILRRLSGSLSLEVTTQNYKKHLDNKYGQ
jgi:hypothetical protein